MTETSEVFLNWMTDWLMNEGMKVAVLLLALCAAVFAIDAVGEGSSEAPDQANPPNWHGSWTSNNRYGGVTYICPQGERYYGVYSNAGFFIGRNAGPRTIEGVWYEGGRGDRNNWQGSFNITISADNQEFDGFYYRVSRDGTEERWHEHRLGAPYPSNPTHAQCLVPAGEKVTGSFFRAVPGSPNANYHICKDAYDQIYGSFTGPDGYIEGWSVDSSTGFHGYRYDSDGRSGAYILRSVSDNEVRGFYWRGRLARQNIETSQEEILHRSSYTVGLRECEQVGPGFLERLRGPTNSAASLSISFLAVLAVTFLLF